MNINLEKSEKGDFKMDEMTIKQSFEQAEGIDTISFQVFPQFVNTKNWWNRRQVYKGVSLEVRKSKYERFYYCHVQAEALNQNMNILGQIKSVVANLYIGHFIEFKCKNANPFVFIFYDCDQLIQLAGIDFHFDFEETKVKIPVRKNRFPTTRYSTDHKSRKSLWIAYDRRPYLHKVNQIKSNLIDRMPYPMRVEIRLRKSNCDYINLENLRGNYYKILFCYLPYIAKSWRSHSKELCSVYIPENDSLFYYIQFLAVSGKSLKLDKSLKPTPKASEPLNNMLEKENTNILDEIFGRFN